MKVLVRSMCYRIAACLAVIVFISTQIRDVISSNAQNQNDLKSHNPQRLDSLHPRWIYLMGGDDKMWLSEAQPGPRSRMASWADDKGNLWTFGGFGIDSEYPAQAHFTNDLWKLDVTTMKWTEVMKPQMNYSQVPIMPPSRRGPVSCGVHELVFVIYGGETIGNEMLDDTWVFDIRKTLWIPLHDIPGENHERPLNPPGRISPVSWCLKDRFIIFGGLSKDGVILQDMWEFSLRTLQWSKIVINKLFSGKATPRTGATSWVVEDKLYMFGGAAQDRNPDKILQSDLWMFSLTTKVWSIVHRGKPDDNKAVIDPGPVPEPRKYAQGWFGLMSNTLYLFGGEGFPDTHVLSKHPILYNQLWGYQLESGRWQKQSYFAAAVIKDENSTVSSHTVRTRGAYWMGPLDTFYTFGGVAYDTAGQLTLLNDVWVLVPPNTPLPEQVDESSLKIIQYPEYRSSSRSPGFIFLMCLLTIGGIVLVVGAIFFLKKMSDYPRHQPSKEYKAKYSKLAREDDHESHDFLLQDEDNLIERKSTTFRIKS